MNLSVNKYKKDLVPQTLADLLKLKPWSSLSVCQWAFALETR